MVPNAGLVAPCVVRVAKRSARRAAAAASDLHEMRVLQPLARASKTTYKKRGVVRCAPRPRRPAARKMGLLFSQTICNETEAHHNTSEAASAGARGAWRPPGAAAAHPRATGLRPRLIEKVTVGHLPPVHRRGGVGWVCRRRRGSGKRRRLPGSSEGISARQAARGRRRRGAPLPALRSLSEHSSGATCRSHSASGRAVPGRRRRARTSARGRPGCMSTSQQAVGRTAGAGDRAPQAEPFGRTSGGPGQVGGRARSVSCGRPGTASARSRCWSSCHPTRATCSAGPRRDQYRVARRGAAHWCGAS